MAVRQTRSHDILGDRYKYDFGECSTKEGWAQVDTRQDASYFGNWCNPMKRQWLSYTGGDVTRVECDTDKEFLGCVLQTLACYEAHDGKRPAIDPGFNVELKAAFERLGLKAWLH
jgi:hypothetical protein